MRTEETQVDYTDPLSRYALLGRASGSGLEMPLRATRIDVAIASGLATVTTERVFQNVEPEGIEAILTFPMPVHATLFDLQVRIGDRLLTATARGRGAARMVYEGAIDRGHLTVLHEEVLRGVHQLSVGQLAPDQEVTVTLRWAMALSAAPGGAMLVIPVTVGDIFGRSKLSDSDDLVHRRILHEADLTVACAEGFARLANGSLRLGATRIRLDAPIRILVSDWAERTLDGTAADGRRVTLRIRPEPDGDQALDAAILVDRSGSMSEQAAGPPAPSSGSKHDVVVAGLREACAHVDHHDRIALWEFSDHPSLLTRGSLQADIAGLTSPGGYTEIGRAIDAVLFQSASRDVLLITDGKSHALDIQAAARSGRRFFVLLIGEDSLEANVGHLAALTGGQVFIAAGYEAGEMARRALAAMRAWAHVAPAIAGKPVACETIQGGMRITAEWHDDPVTDAPNPSKAVAAVASALAIPRLAEAEAAALAEAEGIVCHLTSLVLVDEANPAQLGIPAQRKVATMSPRAAFGYGDRIRYAKRLDGPGLFDDGPGDTIPDLAFLESDFTDLSDDGDLIGGAASAQPGYVTSKRIDWSSDPKALRRGDLRHLGTEVASFVLQAAKRPGILALAGMLGVDPVVAVLALLARLAAPTDRSADRFSRRLLRNAPEQAIEGALRALYVRLGSIPL